MAELPEEARKALEGKNFWHLATVNPDGSPQSTTVWIDARDGKLTRLIVLILTGDNQSQQDLLADASELFSRKEAVEQAIHASNFLELVAALNAPVQ